MDKLINSLKGNIEARSDEKRVSPTRIMIVDDHRGVRVGLNTFLGSHSNLELVAEASNGKEAITKYTNEKPDLVLIDLFLPDISGIILMHKLHLVNVRVPVIILTNTTGSSLSEIAMSAGAACVVDKGTSGNRLIAAICETMDRIESGSAWSKSSSEN